MTAKGRSMKIIILKVLLLALTFQVTNLPAATLVTNLTNPMSEETQFWEGSPLYQSFTVGTSAATIEAVTLSTGFIVNPTGMQVALFSDFSGTPFQSIGTFTFAGPPAGNPYNTPTFTASPGSFNVNANTTYWIQVTSIGGLIKVAATCIASGLPSLSFSIGTSRRGDHARHAKVNARKLEKRKN